MKSFASLALFIAGMLSAGFSRGQPASAPPPDSIACYEASLKKDKPGKEKWRIAMRLSYLYLQKSEYKKGLVVCTQAVTETNKAHDSLAGSDAYGRMAFLYMADQETSKSLEASIQAEKLAPADTLRLALINLQRGELYYYNHDYPHALALFKQTERFAAAKQSKYRFLALIDIGNIYFEWNKLDSSLLSYQKCLTLPPFPDSSRYEILYADIGNVYVETNRNPEGRHYLELALKLALRFNMHIAIPVLYYNLAGAEFDMKKMQDAREHLNLSVSTGFRERDFRNLTYCYKLKARVDSALGDMRAAYTDHVNYILLSDSLHSSDLYNKLAGMQTKFDVEKKDNQISGLTKDKILKNEVIRRQKTMTLLVSIGLLVFGLLSAGLYKIYAGKRKAYHLLGIQKDIIEVKQKEILDSIHYAKRIQKAVVTSDNYISKYIPEFFIFYLPKDIVSGDFYWALQHENKFYLATADCTGHGVPGAFMSLLMITILNEIVLEKNIVKPDLILNEARTQIIKALNQEGEEGANDGMDCSLLCLDSVRQMVEYATANNSFYIIRNKEMIHAEVDKMPVGKSPKEKESFRLFRLKLEKGDLIYTFTDGYADQFGGPKGKKFKYKQLESLLLSESHQPMEIQKNTLSRHFAEWKGNQEQVDDVCIIGFRV